MSGAATVILSDEQLDALARRIADHLRGERSAALALVDAATVAATLGVDRSYVYRHAAELGAVRLGGPRGRLRFPADATLAGRQPSVGSEPARPAARRRRSTGAPGAVLRARPRLPQPATGST